MNPTADMCSMGSIQGSIVGGHGGRYGKTGAKDNAMTIIIKTK